MYPLCFILALFCNFFFLSPSITDFFWLINLYLSFQTPYNLLQYEVSFIVFPMIVKNVMGNGMIIHLWHTNTSLVLRGFVDAHNSDPDSMTRILDICQELKVSLV